MRKTTQHLNDEHMQLYEWSGIGAGTIHALPAKSKRTHSGHASYSVLAVLTSLLLLNGCGNKDAPGKVGARLDQTARNTLSDKYPLYDEATVKPVPAEETGPQREAAAGQASEKTASVDAAVQKP